MKPLLTKSFTLFPFLILGLVACGHEDPAFDQYTDGFKAEAIKQGEPDKTVFSISITFTNELPENGDLALCNEGLSNSIQVLRSAWNTSSEARREMRLFHELGHCILGRGHLNTLDSNEEPVSVMNLTGVDDYNYEKKHAYYMHELFHPTK